MSTTLLEDLIRTQAAFIRVAKQARPAVVNISAVHRPSPISNSFKRFLHSIFHGLIRQGPEANGRQQSTGSGFIISHRGYILTNYHVVAGADEVRVRLLDEREFPGEIIETDERSDLAIVKIQAQTDLPVIALGNSDRLEVGDWVIAIGNPLGLDQTVTVGVISAVGRSDLGLMPRESFIQTDALISFGNSGGPLLNLNGEVIGINTAIVPSGHGIGFAVPVNVVQRMAKPLLTGPSSVPAWLGIMARNATSQEVLESGLRIGERGVWVESVISGSPAESVALQSGDLIIEMDSSPVTDVWRLKQWVTKAAVGARVEVGLMRAGKQERMTVVFAERPSNQEIAQIVRSTGINFP